MKNGKCKHKLNDKRGASPYCTKCGLIPVEHRTDLERAESVLIKTTIRRVSHMPSAALYLGIALNTLKLKMRRYGVAKPKR